MIRRLALTVVATVLGCVGCTTDVSVGSVRRRVEVDAGGGSGGAGGPPRECVPVECLGRKYDCGDCADNDGDDLVDMDDPDCLGPCQNAEDTFYGSIPGQNRARCAQDCYFDFDTGSGNDGCRWTHDCDPLSVAPDYPPEGDQCEYDERSECSELWTQPAECLDYCMPLVPNGCDCFGCCEVPGAPTPVWVGSVGDDGHGSCDFAHVADPSRCRPCTIVPSCMNPCEACEVCVGKPTIPASCTNDPDATSCLVPLCRPDSQPCGSCLEPCPSGMSCITGCCVTPPR